MAQLDLCIGSVLGGCHRFRIAENEKKPTWQNTQ